MVKHCLPCALLPYPRPRKSSTRWYGLSKQVQVNIIQDERERPFETQQKSKVKAVKLTAEAERENTAPRHHTSGIRGRCKVKGKHWQEKKCHSRNIFGRLVISQSSTWIFYLYNQQLFTTPGIKWVWAKSNNRFLRHLVRVLSLPRSRLRSSVISATGKRLGGNDIASELQGARIKRLLECEESCLQRNEQY